MEENIFAVLGCCLQAFSTEKTLKYHVKDCFKINKKKWLRSLKKLNWLNSKLWKKNKIIIYDLCRFGKYFSIRR